MMSGLGAILYFLSLFLPGPASAVERLYFPQGFLWGTAISAFQTEMGANPASVDPNTDWFVWVHDPDNLANGIVSGDLPEDGPGFFDRYQLLIPIVTRKLRNNSLRLSVEWSRVFPTSTAGVDTSGGMTMATLYALDALADQGAVSRYREILAALRTAGITPMVTLLHFTLPTWIHDPIGVRAAFAGLGPDDPIPNGLAPAGWIDAATAAEFEKFAAYAAWKLGDLVDLWATINEPMVVATSGFLNAEGIAANFPPGILSFTALRAAVLNEIEGHVRAYEAIKAWDGEDADQDGQAASVGVVKNIPVFEPFLISSEADRIAAEHANYLFNRVYLNATILGDVDANLDGVIDPGEHRVEYEGKMDFVGLNYYQRAQALSLGGPVTPTIPLFDFAPLLEYQAPLNPDAPLPCPVGRHCSEIGSEIYPAGIGKALAIAGDYGLPVYVTENGIADADDDQRGQYLILHLYNVARAIRDGVADVRGYFHWSLFDNYEWNRGYAAKFGLYSVDPATGEFQRRRRSARFYRRIARRNSITSRQADFAARRGF